MPCLKIQTKKYSGKYKNIGMPNTVHTFSQHRTFFRMRPLLKFTCVKSEDAYSSWFFFLVVNPSTTEYLEWFVVKVETVVYE